MSPKRAGLVDQIIVVEQRQQIDELRHRGLIVLLVVIRFGLRVGFAHGRRQPALARIVEHGEEPRRHLGLGHPVERCARDEHVERVLRVGRFSQGQLAQRAGSDRPR